jgi:hypothetical protein
MGQAHMIQTTYTSYQETQSPITVSLQATISHSDIAFALWTNVNTGLIMLATNSTLVHLSNSKLQQ